MIIPDQFYRHMDGGFYRFVADAISADTGNPVTVYEHLWPFNKGLWVRDREEFLARFQPIDPNVVNAELQGDRAIAQAAVNNAKAIRRAVKAA